MNYSIIGSGAVGTALARRFASSGITVGVANTRGPDSIASFAKELGNKVVSLTLQKALESDVILLAVPFRAHRDVAKAAPTWQGKVVIDVTNAYGVPLSELDNLPSSVVVARSLPGASLVKAFNHLPAGQLGADSFPEGQQQVIFLSSNDPDASTTVGAVAGVDQLSRKNFPDGETSMSCSAFSGVRSCIPLPSKCTR